MRLRSLAWSFAVIACAFAVVSACRSSETSVTGPSGSKCTITLSYTGGVLPAPGGSASIGVTTGRECTWTASTAAPWITIGTASGQGPGSVPFTFTGNDVATQRQGAVEVAGQTLVLNQAGASCVYVIAPTTESVSSGAATVQVSVTALPGCTWAAVSNVPWVIVSSGGSGNGSGQVTLGVSANEGPARSGPVTIATRTFTISQAQGQLVLCTYSISPASQTFGASGGSGSTTVSATSGCSWTATSNASWITLNTASGTGTGAVTFTVAPNGGASRTGTFVAAGTTFTVTQDSGAPNCSYSVSGGTRTFDPLGGSSSIAVSSATGCDWSASSSAPWLRITGGANGSGNGNVGFAVDPNTGANRSATLTVAGQQIQITQTGCSFSIAPSSQSFGSGGGPGSIAVTATAGCTWTAVSNDAWVTITSGGSGSGTGTVSFTVGANGSAARSGTITVAGERFTVNQAAGAVTCTFLVAPLSATFPATGGTASVDVSTTAGCPWTAAANAPWASISAGASGNGPGRVDYTVQANTETAARSGTLTVAGQAVNLTQAAAACTYAIDPTSQVFPASGGAGSINVSAQGGCAWVATSGAPWIQITSGAFGSGSGTVSFNVAANNTGTARQGQITIQGQTFTVNQQ